MEEFSGIRSGGADHVLLRFSGSMTVHNAAEMRDMLLSAFEDSLKLSCSVEKVSDIDLAGLQLLCATHRAAIASGKQFEVAGLEREEMRKVLVDAGFSRHTGCVNDGHNRCLWVGEPDNRKAVIGSSPAADPHLALGG